MNKKVNQNTQLIIITLIINNYQKPVNFLNHKNLYGIINIVQVKSFINIIISRINNINKVLSP
jgi:hypothetical protein